ncbi:MAG: hypothetical protein EZS28_021430 [Streblomastix strix]|uniref:Uncharacterized protein n=1 Tax=Streblomastix strix TaxID=222440 RepID=A0A5J4VKL2_9EUKA|nr:MAG: hypothetical protein EZS28_021430 [Streblomastix strix]
MGNLTVLDWLIKFLRANECEELELGLGIMILLIFMTTQQRLSLEGSLLLLLRVVLQNQVLTNSEKEWKKIKEEKISSQIFRENWARYKTFLEENSDGLEELDEKKVNEMEELSCKYIDTALNAVSKRFQDNNIMTRFNIFDGTAVPEKIDDNSDYVNSDMVKKKWQKSMEQVWNNDDILTKRNIILTKMRDMIDIEDKSMLDTKINNSNLHNMRRMTSSLGARLHL